MNRLSPHEKIGAFLAALMWMRDAIPLLPPLGNLAKFKKVKEAAPDIRRLVDSFSVEYALLDLQSRANAALDHFDMKSATDAELEATRLDAMQTMYNISLILDTALTASMRLEKAKAIEFSAFVQGEYERLQGANTSVLKEGISKAFASYLAENPQGSYTSFNAGYLAAIGDLIEKQ